MSSGAELSVFLDQFGQLLLLTFRGAWLETSLIEKEKRLHFLCRVEPIWTTGARIFLISIHRKTDLNTFKIAGKTRKTWMRIWLKLSLPVDRQPGARRNGRTLHRRPFYAAAAGQRPLWPPSHRQSWRPAGGGGSRYADRLNDQHAGQEHKPKMALPAWRRYRWLTLPRPPELYGGSSGLTLPTIFLLYFALLFSSGQYHCIFACILDVQIHRRPLPVFSQHQQKKEPTAAVSAATTTALYPRIALVFYSCNGTTTIVGRYLGKRQKSWSFLMDYSFVDVSKKRDTAAADTETHLFVIVCNRKYSVPASAFLYNLFFGGTYWDCKLANIYFLFTVSGNPDAPHITAIAGQKITLNCDVNFPNGVASPYVVQWWRKVKTVYIFYEGY